MLQAPFPWFGGKSRVAPVVWRAFGDVVNYVEPFFGSGAVLLGRPSPFAGTETVNDKDGYLANFWRALKADPEAVAYWADQPVNENDLHARHSWLVSAKQGFVSRMEGDPDFHDAKAAGFWAWGLCCWIGSGWCSGNGPWRVVNGKLVHLSNAGHGVNRSLIHLSSAGQGVNRQLVHLGDAGQGVNRKLVHLGDAGQGVNRQRELIEWFTELSERLRRVRVCSGDWARVLGPTPTTKRGLSGVFLDPPYGTATNRAEVYTEEDFDVSASVRDWAIEHGSDPMLRIALCGYQGEHELPGWTCHEWKAAHGYAGQSQTGNENCAKERIWFSPSCLPLLDHQRGLFGAPESAPAEPTPTSQYDSLNPHPNASI
ncbi:MAG TPA: DNA adenine methylase [Terriglobia bacterium]|nr:DNA adenine methylase [Terriglobia bacterium]